MSLLTQSKVASVNTPVTNKGRRAYLSTKNCYCWTDENGAQWWYGEQRVRLDADNAGTSSSTLADVTGLVFPVLAATRYGFEFCLEYTTTVVTSGLKVGLTCPASPTYLSAGVEINGFGASGADAAWEGVIVASGGAVTATDAQATGTVYPAYIRGTLVNGANAGNLQAQWANEAAAGTVVIKNGSWGRMWLL